MPNIASVLKNEISRLARKDLRQETESLHKAVSRHRSDIAALKRRIDTLERQQKQVIKAFPTSASKKPASEVILRFRAEGFAAHRRRLGLSAREMGMLLDASPLSVYKWEQGQARPRAKHLQAIAAVRKMGKREVIRRLEALNAT